MRFTVAGRNNKRNVIFTFKTGAVTTDELKNNQSQYNGVFVSA
jgi:hypothetical protein